MPGFDLARYERDLRTDLQNIARRLAAIANELREAAADLTAALVAQAILAPAIVVHDSDSETSESFASTQGR